MNMGEVVRIVDIVSYFCGRTTKKNTCIYVHVEVTLYHKSEKYLWQTSREIARVKHTYVAWSNLIGYSEI